MSLSKRLFRESALERLSSPEQLDQQLQVTSPKGWVALIAIWVLLAGVILWSLICELPTKEDGHGIIVVGGGLRVVVAPGAGRVAEILVEVDDSIETGQAVAVIDKPAVRDELAETLQQLEQKRGQNERLDEFDRDEEELQASLAVRERERLQQIIEFSEQRLERLHDQRQIVKDLVDKGMMMEIELHQVKEDIERTELDQVKAQLEMEQVVKEMSEDRFRRERDRMTRQFELEQLQSKVDVLRSRYDRESQVIAQFAGTVVELRAAEHTTVDEGDPILLVEPSDAEGGELEAILYVSAATGMRIDPGLKAHISPTTVKQEEFGSIKGEVISRAPGPTSTPAMMVRLNDEDLVNDLTEQIGVPLEVRVALQTDESTFSGFAWTSSDGPPRYITPGTLCEGTVTVEWQRPIELLIPFLRKKLGFSE